MLALRLALRHVNLTIYIVIAITAKDKGDVIGVVAVVVRVARNEDRMTIVRLEAYATPFNTFYGVGEVFRIKIKEETFILRQLKAIKSEVVDFTAGLIVMRVEAIINAILVLKVESVYLTFRVIKPYYLEVLDDMFHTWVYYVTLPLLLPQGIR